MNTLKPHPLHKSRLSLGLLLAFILVGQAACKHSGPEASSRDPATASAESIRLKPGFKFLIRQRALWVDPMGGKLNVGEGLRTITLDNASSAEGLSFEWSLVAKVGSDLKLPLASPSPMAPSEPVVSQEMMWEGKMTLADTVAGKQMTLPLFWPPGELFLANNTAVWLSDKTFEDLKKNKHAEILPGLFGNALLGPLQEIKMFPRMVDQMTAALANDPKIGPQWSTVKVVGHEKLPLKVNGSERMVPVLEAQSDLAHYVILDEVQNPLVLQFTVAPHSSLSQLLFSPLAFLKGFVDYEVTEIQTSAGTM